jgi:chromatin segregation and condensation protein Rec8/ScpA/Scc1 (kleisin family)
LLLNLPKVELVPQAVIKKVISIEEVIGNLTKRIQGALKMRFSEFVGGSKAERIDIVVSFLGMLELVKQGLIDVRQEKHFQDIDMETRDTSAVPNYS